MSTSSWSSNPCVLLVRHAKARSRAGWEGDDSRRPLTRGGRAQADQLVQLLSAFSPERVLSSPHTRCHDTVGPLAKSLGLVVETTDALAEGNATSAIDLVRSLAGTRAVACTHGDIVPAVLDSISRKDGVEIPSPALWAKGSVWILEAGDGASFRSAAYVPAPPARPS